MIIHQWKNYISSDTDARIFNDVAVENYNVRVAIHDMVTSLKTKNIWNSITALYPFAGANEFSHSINLKDVNTYKLTFYGGWTHDNLGITGNGIDSYADTGLAMNVLSQNSAHVGIFCKADTTGNYYDIGVGSSSLNVYTHNNIKISNLQSCRLNSNVIATKANTDSKGFFCINRTAAAKFTIQKDGPPYTSGTSASVNPASTLTYYIGNNNIDGSPVAGFYSNRNYTIVTIGAGLTSNQQIDLYPILATFQNQLGRYY